MTIGIGMIGKDCIVLASDSRTQDDENKSLDLPKIALFSCGDLHVGIAQAGATDFSSRAVKLIRQRSTEALPKTALDFERIVEGACVEIRNYINSINPGIPHSATDAAFSIIVGLYDKNGPYLFKVDSMSGFAKEHAAGVLCIGKGELLGRYILDGIPSAQKISPELIVTAIYAVEVIIKKESSCEGPTRIGLVFPSGVQHLADALTENFAVQCRRFEKENQKAWTALLADDVLTAYIKAGAKNHKPLLPGEDPF